MKYSVVGYGSLISHQSLEWTIPDKEFTPVIVKGYKRIFDLELGKKRVSDVLNVEESEKDFFNGVLFEVNEEELEELKKRETEYLLKEVWVYDFFSKEKLCKAWIFTDLSTNIDKKGTASINKSYFNLCRDAAYLLGEEFGKCWDKTTYTPKGEKVADVIETIIKGYKDLV